MPVAPGDRTGRLSGHLDTLDPLADVGGARTEGVDADLAVRHAGAQRAEFGRGVVLRHAQVECLVLQSGEIRRDLGSRIEPARLVPADAVERVAVDLDARIVSPSPFTESVVATPRARGVARVEALLLARGPVDVGRWEPSYGRLAEAQVRWESAHGRPLSAG